MLDWPITVLKHVTAGKTLMDRLGALFEHFSLSASVFNTGPLCRIYDYSEKSGYGYVHFVQQGALRLEIVGQSIETISAPSVLLLLRPTDHRLLPLPGDEVVSICGEVRFAGTAAGTILQFLPKVLAANLDENSPLKETTQLLLNEAFSNFCGRQAALNRICELLIIQLLRLQLDQLSAQEGILAGLSDAQLSKVLTAIHTRPESNWTLDSMAAVASMSRASFAGKFKKIVGTTPGDYLSSWRLGLAQAILKRGDSVAQAAELAGFSSSAALSRAFSQRFNYSPSAWARLQQKTKN